MEESAPWRYIKFEQGNVEAAVLRLVKYWNLRRMILEDRAFQSLMDLSGEGALSREETGFVTGGMTMILPPDYKGRPGMTHAHC